MAAPPEAAPSSVLKQIWVRTLILTVFLLAAMFADGLISQVGVEALAQSKRILLIAVQIGIWFSAAAFVNRLIRVFIWDGVVAAATGGPVPRLLRDVVTIILFLIAASGIIAFVFDKSITGIWATSGVIGLVIGLAIQSIILDLFVGLAINIERPFKIGDYISVHPRDPSNKVFGKVVEINWRTTRIQTNDDNVVIFPNSLIGHSMVTNVSLPSPPRRLEVELTLDPTVPVERARRVLLAGAMAVIREKGMVDDPAPKVLAKATTPVGIEYEIRFYTQIGTGNARDKVLTSVLEHLRQAGIGLAYPKQDVFHAPMPERHVDARSREGLAQLLGRIPLFEPLEKSDLLELAGEMKMRLFKGGQAVIRMGEQGDSMFVLVEGLLEVFAVSGAEGNEIRVAQIVPGRFFGEMSLLTGEPRSATVKAVTETVVYEITKPDMAKLLERRPSLAEEISRVVAERKAADLASRGKVTDAAKEKEGLADQILNKMRNFFKGSFFKS